MKDDNRKSILEMARGAFLERADCEMARVIENILDPMNPSTTFLYVAGEESVVEMAPQIPGQLSMDEGEQEAPPRLKVIKTA